VASFDEVIPPGQVGHIDAKLDTHKLRGSVGRGITVYTDDPALPKVFLTVKATVVGGVVVLPQEMLSVAGRGRGRNIPSVLLRREASETGQLEIADATPSVPWLVVTTEKLEQSRPGADGMPAGMPGDWLVGVTLGPSAPYGRFRESLKLKTGLERQPELTIPVLVTRQAPIRLSAERVAFPREVDPGQQPQTVLLTVRRDLDPTALTVETDSELLTVELEPSGRRGYKVHVRWQGEDRPRGAITFRLGEESYELPVVEPEDPS
jgi:hypothetical protein